MQRLIRFSSILAFWFAVAGAWADSPNFILILADDQGWNGTSVAMDGSPESKSDYYHTPNLERLAKEGVRFSQGYAPAALCCPTRRSIQFGHTPARMGDDEAFARRYPVDNERLTIPRALKAANAKYTCAHFGKWDLRTDLTPEHLGYDESDGNTGNTEGNVGTDFGETGKWTEHGILDDPKRIFSVTRRGVDFMQRAVADERPFYLQLSHYAVHVDMQSRQASLDAAEARIKGERHKLAPFAAMTEDLDAGVGQVLDVLDELGIADNTYVIYTADNGAVPWIPPDKVKHFTNPLKLDDQSRNHPLRGGKWTLFEGGIRVPFLMRGPAAGKNALATTPVGAWDLLPTFARLAEYPMPLPDDLDGRDIRPFFDYSTSEVILTHDLIWHRYASGYAHSAIRDRDYKLVEFWKPDAWPLPAYVERLQLYDLSRDPGETNNLAEDDPERTAVLRKKLHAYIEEVELEVTPYP